MTDDSAAIQSAVNFASANHFLLYFPTGSYKIENTIICSQPINMKSESGVKLVAKRGITALYIQTSNVTIQGIDIESETKDYTQNSFGILVGNKDASNKYTFLYNILISDITIRYFTTSLSFEGCYWCEVNNVHTFYDKYGVTINKDCQVVNGSGAIQSTTMYFNRVYCHGSNGSSQVTGSIGWIAFDVVNLTYNGCVSEWYEKAGEHKTCQAITLNDVYIERCTVSGLYFFNITGTLVVKNLYSSQVNQFTLSWAYATLVLIGGRSIHTPRSWVLEKSWESKLIELAPIQHVGADYYIKPNGGYESQNINRLSTLTVNENGLALDKSNQGIILIAPNGTKYKVTINNSGNLIITKL